MIPEGWKKKSLEDVAEIRGGLAKGKEAFHQVVYRPYLRVANVQDGYLDLQTIKEIEVQIKDIERYSLRHGDVVLTEGGDFDKLGRGAVWKEQIPGCLHQNHVFVVRVDRNFLLPEFFAAQSASHYGKSYYLSCAKRSTNLASINSTQLKQFPVLLPPLPEQRRIAEILATWDRAIETVEALIANARAQKKALMQSLLTGKRRLPGFSGKWTIKQLGEAFAERSERGGDNLTLLSVTQSDGVVPQTEAGRKNISSTDQSGYKTVRKGDIAYNTMRMWQGASALSSITGKVSPAYTIVTARHGHDAKFYAYLFKWPQMIHVFERHSQGLVSDTWNLKYPHFSKILVSVPLFDEQVAIRQVLGAGDEEEAALRRQLTALRQEKSALMQQLLTGKRRVKLDVGEVAHA